MTLWLLIPLTIVLSITGAVLAALAMPWMFRLKFPGRIYDAYDRYLYWVERR